MKQTIYLDFGVLESQAEVKVTLEWVEAWVAAREVGKPTSEEFPAGYAVTDIRWGTPLCHPVRLWNKYNNSEHFASAVHSALRDEGISI